MRRISGIFALAWLATAMTTATQAEVVRSPARALELLTQARVAAAKCGWLDAARRQELASLAAQAELVAVRQAGAAKARAALSKGRAQGEGACSQERRELVLAIYEGAHEAAGGSRLAAAASSRARRVRKAPRQWRREAAKPRMEARVQRASWKPQARPAGSGKALVERYRRLAADYYQALKCRDRQRDEMMRMWRKVRDLHYATLRLAGRERTARAKAAAAREGEGRACH